MTLYVMVIIGIIPKRVQQMDKHMVVGTVLDIQEALARLHRCVCYSEPYMSADEMISTQISSMEIVEGS